MKIDPSEVARIFNQYKGQSQLEIKVGKALGADVDEFESSIERLKEWGCTSESLKELVDIVYKFEPNAKGM